MNHDINIDINKPSHELAVDLWERVIYPIIQSKHAIEGDTSAVDLFYDLLYFMFSARMMAANADMASAELKDLVNEAYQQITGEMTGIDAVQVTTRIS